MESPSVKVRDWMRNQNLSRGDHHMHVASTWLRLKIPWSRIGFSTRENWKLTCNPQKNAFVFQERLSFSCRCCTRRRCTELLSFFRKICNEAAKAEARLFCRQDKKHPKIAEQKWQISNDLCSMPGDWDGRSGRTQWKMWFIVSIKTLLIVILICYSLFFNFFVLIAAKLVADRIWQIGLVASWGATLRHLVQCACSAQNVHPCRVSDGSEPLAEQFRDLPLLMPCGWLACKQASKPPWEWICRDRYRGVGRLAKDIFSHYFFSLSIMPLSSMNPTVQWLNWTMVTLLICF